MNYFNLITTGAISIAAALGIITAMYFNQDRLDRSGQIMFSLIATIVSSIQVGVSLIPIYEPYFNINEQKYITFIVMTTLGVVVTLNLILQVIYITMDRKREREKAREKASENKTSTSEDKVETNKK